MGEFDQIIEAMQQQYGFPDTSQPTLNPPEPVHPVPLGGNIPQMNLAGVDGFNVASGYARQPMPDPGKPAPYDPVLSGSPECGGYDPANPSPAAPNLAGIEGMPTKAYIADMKPGTWKQNVGGDYIAPSTYNPTTRPYDLTEPGIDYGIGGEFGPDPMLPDLTQYNQPMGLDIHNIVGTGDPLWRPDPVLGDLTDFDVVSGLEVTNHPLDPDPTVPDLQNPQLVQDAHMLDRPGDLDASAIGIMHVDPTHIQDDGESYQSVFMDPTGMNNSRRRRSVLRDGGLHSTDDGGM